MSSTLTTATGLSGRHQREGTETVSTSETESTATASTMPSLVPTPRRPAAAELTSEHGRTSISDVVVAKIVAIATREVDGVYVMGTGAARMIGSVRQRVPGTRASETQGVAVEVGERQAAADLDLVVEYGVSIPDLAAAVRGNVIGAVERICGLEVTEVNIGIDDIHLPGDEDTDTSASRVQ
jgi:uncharacterized alkaline shock family protein YloU